MSTEQFRAFLNLLMCSDPYPCDGQLIVEEFANNWSRVLGYNDWIDAYHQLRVD